MVVERRPEVFRRAADWIWERMPDVALGSLVANTMAHMIVFREGSPDPVRAVDLYMIAVAIVIVLRQR